MATARGSRRRASAPPRPARGRARPPSEIDAFHRRTPSRGARPRHAERRIQRRARLHAAARQDGRRGERAEAGPERASRQREQSVIERAAGGAATPRLRKRFGQRRANAQRERGSRTGARFGGASASDASLRRCSCWRARPAVRARARRATRIAKVERCGANAPRRRRDLADPLKRARAPPRGARRRQALLPRRLSGNRRADHRDQLVLGGRRCELVGVDDGGWEPHGRTRRRGSPRSGRWRRAVRSAHLRAGLRARAAPSGRRPRPSARPVVRQHRAAG